MELVQSFVHRYARRISVNGVRMLSTNGDPLLLAAFEQLGWPDPAPELPPDAESDAPEAAALGEPEHAVLPKARKRS